MLHDLTTISTWLLALFALLFALLLLSLISLAAPG